MKMVWIPRRVCVCAEHPYLLAIRRNSEMFTLPPPLPRLGNICYLSYPAVRLVLHEAQKLLLPS